MLPNSMVLRLQMMEAVTNSVGMIIIINAMASSCRGKNCDKG